MWLRDLLPQRVPNARIMTFGYDAYTLKLSDVSHLTLNGHAASFIADLLRIRKESEASTVDPVLEAITNVSMSVDSAETLNNTSP